MAEESCEGDQRLAKSIKKKYFSKNGKKNADILIKFKASKISNQTLQKKLFLQAKLSKKDNF